MCATVVIVGIPQYITANEVRQSLQKLFNVRTRPFQVRDLRKSRYSISKWQFALDFDSAYEATTAQKILHGYNYVLPNGVAYVLCAKITEDPVLIRQEKILVPTTDSTSGHCDGDWDIVGLVPKLPEAELHSTCTGIDAQIEFLKKQKLLVQAERELLREQRQLWKEYNRKDDSDSDHQRRRRFRSSRRHRNRSKIRDRSRSRSSRSSTQIRPISILRDFPNDGLVLPDATYLEKSTDSRSSVADHTSYNKLLQESQSNCDQKETFYKTTVHEYDNVNTNAAGINKLYTRKRKDANIRFEINDTIRKIMEEMDTILDHVCYKKNINIIEKGWNDTITRKIKDIIRERMESLEITNWMSSSSLILYYRRFYNANDDIKLVEKLINEYLEENPHIQNKCVVKSIDSSESSLKSIESEENSMWRAVDEVLQDIDIETLSSEYDEETNLNVKHTPIKFDNMGPPSFKEVIDMTQEPVMDTKNNTQVEIILMQKNNITVKGDKQRKEIKRTQIHRSENYIENVNRIINPNPIFYITVKVILKQMKYYIEEYEQTTGVNDFKAIVETRVRDKLGELLKGKGYIKSAGITKLFREIYPRSNDRDFIKSIAESTVIEKKDCNGTEHKVPNCLASVAV